MPRNPCCCLLLGTHSEADSLVVPFLLLQRLISKLGFIVGSGFLLPHDSIVLTELILLDNLSLEKAPSQHIHAISINRHMSKKVSFRAQF